MHLQTIFKRWLAPAIWRGIRPWARHGLVLLVAGLIYVGIGIAYMVTEPTPSRTVALEYAFNWWGATAWGMVFVVAGILTIISSRWPPVSETWGYSVLTGLSAGWSGFYAAGVVFGDSSPSNMSSVLVWGLIAFMWWAISGLVNPEGGVKSGEPRPD